jgi:hypothetical protein
MQLQTTPLNSNSKIFLLIGGNDLLYKYAFLPFLRDLYFPYNPIDNIKTTIEKLTTELHVPVKNIYVLNFPDLSNIPLMSKSLQWNGFDFKYDPA